MSLSDPARLPTKCRLTCNTNRVHFRQYQQLRLDRCGARPARLVSAGRGPMSWRAAPRRAVCGCAARLTLSDRTTTRLRALACGFLRTRGGSLFACLLGAERSGARETERRAAMISDNEKKKKAKRAKESERARKRYAEDAEYRAKKL